MKCSECNTQNLSTARFCKSCGSQLGGHQPINQNHVSANTYEQNKKTQNILNIVGGVLIIISLYNFRTGHYIYSGDTYVSWPPLYSSLLVIGGICIFIATRIKTGEKDTTDWSKYHKNSASTQSKSSNTETNKKALQLKNIALMLDKACKDGVVVDEKVEKAQDVLNSINEQYQDNNNILGPDGYLIYEVQGLIHWVKGEEKDAKDLIRSARNTKGDSRLFTDSANDL
jgi:hypothetical protein